MKKRSIVEVLLTAVAAFFLAVAVCVSVRVVGAQLNSAATYRITYHTTMSMVDGSLPTREFDTLESRRGNGDVLSFSSTRPVVTIDRYAQGLKQQINKDAGLMVTYGDGVPAAVPTYSKGKNCEAYRGLTSETQTILGFRTIKVIGEGSDTDTVVAWIAPDLDCQVLQETHSWLRDGLVFTTNVKVATSAAVAPVEDSAFDLPPSITEVPPNTFWAASGNTATNPKMMDMYSKQKAQRESRAH